MATAGGIRLFDADPDLLERIPEPDRPLALRSALVPVHRAPVGPLDMSDLAGATWGGLVTEGLLACEVGVAGSTAAELIGAGDVLLPAPGPGQAFMVPSQAAWTVLEPVTVAVLDEHFGPIARRWPQVAGLLLERTQRRVHRLAIAQAIGHLTRVDTRVLVTLWVLADRWGRVGSDAIVLPVRLTHRTLARLIGARRPSVTSAISDLSRRGLVARREDGAWLLPGGPPAELERFHLQPQILPAPAPPPRPGALAPEVRRDAHVPDRVRTLLAAYDQQARRVQRLAERSQATRDRSRQLREQAQSRRESPALNRSPSAPPST